MADYTRPGQWIFVGGFGAGGDVRGALGAGLNVVALENDPKQVQATVASMRTFSPSSNLGFVYTHDHLVFGYKNLAFHDEQDEPFPPLPHCNTCDKDFVQEAKDCSLCGAAGCPDCFSGEPVKCKSCRQPPAIKLVEEVPAIAAVSEEVPLR